MNFKVLPKMKNILCTLKNQQELASFADFLLHVASFFFIFFCAWCLHDASSYVDVDPGGGLLVAVPKVAEGEEDTHQDANNR